MNFPLVTPGEYYENNGNNTASFVWGYIAVRDWYRQW